MFKPREDNNGFEAEEVEIETKLSFPQDNLRCTAQSLSSKYYPL
jgi:hypothetical protein